MMNNFSALPAFSSPLSGVVKSERLFAEANRLHFKLRDLVFRSYLRGLPPVRLSRLIDRSYKRVNRRYDLMKGV